MSAWPALAQETSDGFAAPLEQADIRTAPVVLDGATLFRLRGVTEFPAAERAHVVAERIRKIARDPSLDPQSIKVTQGDYGLELTIGDTVIITFVDGDAELEGVHLPLLADIARDRIIQAIESYRAERTRSAIMASAVRAGIALAVAVVAIVAVYFLSRWLLRWVNRSRALRRKEVKIQDLALLRAEHIYAGLRILIQTVRCVLIAVLFFAGLDYALDQFPWSRSVGITMQVNVVEPLTVIALAILESIPNFFYIAIIAAITVFLLRLMLMVFRAIERGSVVVTGFDPDWAIPTFKAVRLLVIVLAVVAAYPYIPGSHSEAFKGVSILLGLMLSLGSSSVISSIIAGYTLIYRRAFKVGDWIQVDETVGRVTDRRLLVTHLVSRKNEAIVLSNSQIINADIINFTTMANTDGLILHTEVGIGYDVPWQKVEELLIDAAGRVEGLLDEPPPFVLEKSLDNYSVTYEINAYCREPARVPELYAQLHRSILTVFSEQGVAIMTPTFVSLPAGEGGSDATRAGEAAGPAATP